MAEDSCCFAYVPTQQKVWAGPRGIRALIYGANLADNSAHESGGYVRRLEKYDGRGFCVAVPGFVPEKLSRAVLGEHLYLDRYDVVLRPKFSSMEDIDATNLPLLTFAGSQLHRVRQELRAATLEACEAVRGFERLVVLKYGNVKVCRSGGGSMPCVPLRVEGRRYTILWGAGLEEDDDEEYSASPQASAHALLRENADHEVEMSDTPQREEFAWWTGGAMQKFTRKPLKQCVTALREATATRFFAHQHLQFVYDLVPSGTPFDQLKYVLDAARKPLDGAPNFREVYGLDRCLCFRRAEERASRPQDWWAVYE